MKSVVIAISEVAKLNIGPRIEMEIPMDGVPIHFQISTCCLLRKTA